MRQLDFGAKVIQSGKFISPVVPEANMRKSWEEVLGKPVSKEVVQEPKVPLEGKKEYFPLKPFPRVNPPASNEVKAEEAKVAKCSLCSQELKDKALALECEHRAHTTCIIQYIQD